MNSQDCRFCETLPYDHITYKSSQGQRFESTRSRGKGRKRKVILAIPQVFDHKRLPTETTTKVKSLDRFRKTF